MIKKNVATLGSASFCENFPHYTLRIKSSVSFQPMVEIK